MVCSPSILVFVAGLVAFACDPDPEPQASANPVVRPDVEFTVITRNLHIALLSDLDQRPLCAGTITRLDDFVDAVTQELNLSLSRRIDLYLSLAPYLDLPLDDQCTEWLNLDRWINGCYVKDASGSFAVSVLGSVAHELIHGITLQHGGSWWAEGVACAYSPPFNRAPHKNIVFTDNLYAWGHLARWIVDIYGGDTFMTLYRGTPRMSNQAAVEAATFDVLGTELPALLSDHAALAPTYYPDPWSCYAHPDAPAAPWVDGQWHLSVHLDCDSDLTYNANHPNPRMATRVPITIPEDGPYRFHADHPDASLSLQPCPEHSLDDDWALDAASWPLQLPGSALIHQHLQAGSYVLIAQVPLGPPQDLRLIATPALN